MPEPSGAANLKSSLRTQVRNGLGRLGLAVYTIPRSGGGEEYAAPTTPLADYTPWNNDEDFLATYERIRDYTVVDMYRCWELWSLVAESAKSSGSLVEVGVWHGGSGTLIAQRARSCGITDPVFLCDTFEGVVKAGDKDPVFVGGELADTSKAGVERLVGEFGLQDVEVLEGVFPEAGIDRLRDQRFRFCHIDVDVYQSALDVTEWIWDRMVIGGIVVYDDYGFGGAAGVTKAVEELALPADRIRLHNLNGHGILIKTA